MISMTERAERELRLAGFFDTSTDYDGMIGPAVMEIFKTFTAQGHSGSSAGIVAHLFKTLADGETLAPITDDPDEWEDVTAMGAPGSPAMYQSKRNFALMSHDCGKTYWHVDDETQERHYSEPSGRAA